MPGKGGVLFFVASFLVLTAILTGGRILPFIIVGIIWLYRWAKEKEKPAPQRPVPGPVSVPTERPADFSYGASDGSLGFEVPPLAGAPKSGGDGVYREPSVQERPVRERAAAREKVRLRRQGAAQRAAIASPSMAAGPSSPAPRLTPAALADAVVLAELLAPPKALRHRHRGL